MKKLLFFVPLLLLVFTYFMSVAPAAPKIVQPAIVEKEVASIMVINTVGLNPNEIISRDMDFYIEAYAKKEEISKNISSIIIFKSLEHSIPINIVFSICSVESDYIYNKYNRNNENGSFDYGIIMLNSFTFGKDIDIKYNSADKNLQVGLSYLKELYDKYHSYDLAIVSYNCGRPERFNPLTASHIIKIKAKEKELDEWFYELLRNKMSRNIN